MATTKAKSPLQQKVQDAPALRQAQAMQVTWLLKGHLKNAQIAKNISLDLKSINLFMCIFSENAYIRLRTESPTA